MEYKSATARVEIKEAAEGSVCSLKAYGAAFGNIDSYGDVIPATAFDKWLSSASSDRLALCWQHDMTEPIGIIRNKGVDEYGLWFDADILPTTQGKDAAVLLKAGAVKEFSIGYIPDVYHFETRDGRDVRVLDEVSVWEISPVTRAANPKAVATAVKNETNNKKSEDMTDEMKAMQASIEASVKADAIKEIEGAKADLNAIVNGQKKAIEEQREAIDNLDKSAKDLKASIDSMKETKTADEMASYKSAVAKVLNDNREKIEALVKSGHGSMKMEFKLSTANITALSFGVQQLPGVSSAPFLPNVFLDNLVRVPQSGNAIAWLEGTQTSNAGYVDELAAATDNTYTVTEKQRKYAKIGAALQVSSETANWFEAVMNWAREEAARDIEAKADAFLWSGDGSDATYPKHVYGLVGESTAFSAIGSYASANIADVLNDAVMQVAKHGFTANVAFVSYEGLAALRGLKSTTGNYLYNEATGMLGQLRILPSVRLTAKQAMVMDSRCARCFDDGEYEIEIARLANVDGWGVYVRKHVQKVTKTAEKLGVIYVADTDTAITAISAS